MNFEQVQRTMEFILEHQAQATIQMQQLTGKMDQLTGKMDQLTGNMDQLTGNVGQLSGKTRDMQAVVLLPSDLAQIQSRRLDRQGEEFQALLKHYDEGQKIALASLAEILRRLSERG